ncbi:MAG: peptidoglycan-binding protein [Cyanobacteria bacterium P01_A01_bin.40]
MSTSQTVIKIAKAEIGYQVASGHPTKYGRWYAPDDIGFYRAAWCAMFVSWVFAHAGLKLDPIQNDNGFAYCPYGLRWFKSNGQLFRNPQRGDIVFFDWGRDGVSDHVGIVEEVHPRYIKTIEGNTSVRNQSNGGGVMSRVRYYPSCCGFARPKYKSNGISTDWTGFYLQVTNPLTERPEVGLVQSKLNKLGYELEVDNYYGMLTEAAVKKFQSKQGLSIDGIVGPETWQWLFITI